MAQYTASTSDKLKSVALHKFWISGFGMLGLHYFYVGRYGKGILHIVFSFIYLMVLISIFSPASETGAAPIGYIVLWVAIAVLINLRTFIKLKSGAFRDNVGAPLREN